MLRTIRARYDIVLAATAHKIGDRGIHPNVLTTFSFLPALAAGGAAAAGQFLLAALLLGFSGIFDLLDGAVARASHKTSRFGALLDSAVDRLSDATVPIGLVIYYAPMGAWVLVPVLAMVSAFTISYVRARAEGLQFTLPRLWMRREDRMIITLLGLLLAPLPLPTIAIPAAPLMLVQALQAILGFAAAAAALLAAYRS